MADERRFGQNMAVQSLFDIATGPVVAQVQAGVESASRRKW